ncbi:MAG TPA: DUF2950 domain-containing protein [Methylomirabilota bacterium]|nr:DUF2950 domain-containing protein [Methylomirabilota bacterium]
MGSGRRSWVRSVVTVAALVALGLGPALPAPVAEARAPRLSGSPEEIYKAFVEALRAGDRAAMLKMLGPEASDVVSSGDDVSDRRVWRRFVEKYDQEHKLEASGGRVTLIVGSDDFPLPIPLVPDAEGWRFDTEAGRQEILNRRVGRNELAAIQVCLAYVDAQREYYTLPTRGKTGLLEYAQRIRSTPGKRDGLFWPTRPGEPPSPLGDLAARARAEGYRAQDRPTPYHGYYYRILTAQGADAPGGAYDYVVRGHMIGGFALVAFPAAYGDSGIMTFIVSHDGVVYQKDLGPDTSRIAQAMKVYNPDASWRRVEPAR